MSPPVGATWFLVSMVPLSLASKPLTELVPLFLGWKRSGWRHVGVHPIRARGSHPLDVVDQQHDAVERVERVQ